MSKTLTTLLSGAAALTLLAGAGVAAAQSPQDAALQAAEDARVAAARARESGRDARDAGRDARDAARDARHKAMDEAHKARGAADEARRQAHAHRAVFHGSREEHLRTMLQLRESQEPALKAYLEAVGHGGGRRDHMVRFDRGDTRSTTERLAEMEAKMAEQQAAMRRRIEATKTFYGQLDDKQKKVFDSMPMLMFAGPGFGPMLLPVAHIPPIPPSPPRL